MDVMEITSQINKAFQKDGLDVKGYNVRCVAPLNAMLYSGQGPVQLVFSGNRPTLSIVKIITFSVELEEVYIDTSGAGKIKLKNFPDINFNIDDDTKAFGAPPLSSQYEVLSPDTYLNLEMDSEFKDPQSRRLAGKALGYAQAWAAIALEGGTDFAGASSSDIKKLKRECYKFTQQQMKSEVSGSVIAILLINLVLPYIIKWIVERVIDRMINN